MSRVSNEVETENNCDLLSSAQRSLCQSSCKTSCQFRGKDAVGAKRLRLRAPCFTRGAIFKLLCGYWLPTKSSLRKFQIWNKYMPNKQCQRCLQKCCLYHDSAFERLSLHRAQYCLTLALLRSSQNRQQLHVHCRGCRSNSSAVPFKCRFRCFYLFFLFKFSIAMLVVVYRFIRCKIQHSILFNFGLILR